MNKFGFYIKRLRIVGDNVENAEVEFSTGLNVIYGPSNTGKTYIYQCIDYMLGSSQRPKEIPEAKSYNKCFLEINSYDEKPYTLERSLKGGDFKLYEDKMNNLGVSIDLKADNQSNKDSISEFLLKLCNIKNMKIRKNAKGITQNLYFQDLKQFFMVDEAEIITESSPIAPRPTRVNKNIQRTFQENILKFLLTGQDDSSISALLTKDDVTNKKGKLELLEEIIDKIEVELAESTNIEEINAQIERIDNSIESFEKDYSITKERFNEYEAEKNQIYKDIVQKETRINTLNEILKRSSILAKQYNSDIDRLKATTEVSQAIDAIEVLNCPLCKSELKNDKIEIVDLESIILASKKEIEKITLLSNELNESIKLFEEERTLLRQEHDTTKSNYNKILDTIENEVNRNLSEVAKQLNVFSNKKSELTKTKTMREELKKFEEQKCEIDKVVEDNKNQGKDTDYEKLTTALLQPLTESMHTILKEIKFDNLGNSVGFSEEYFDFVIAEQNRKDFGKGYRAILYAVFTVSLLRHLKSKLCKIGFTLIDSPLNPYKPDEASEGKIPSNLASNYYTYLYNNIKAQQVIIIENTKVPQDFENDIQHIKYNKENGFIPKS